MMKPMAVKEAEFNSEKLPGSAGVELLYQLLATSASFDKTPKEHQTALLAGGLPL